MKILLLTQVVPYPPDSGPKIKTYNVLRYLAQQHEVRLISFARTPAEEYAARSLRKWCQDVVTVPITRSKLRDLGFFLRSLITGRPFLVERDDMVAMHRLVRDVVAQWQPDAVHADQLSMGQFALDLPVSNRVLDEHNAVWTIVRRAAEHEAGMRRLAAELEWRKLRRYERDLCQRFDAVTLVSEEDRLALQSASGSRPTLPGVVIPIAVDTDELAFHERSRDARDVLSVATMFYPPNVEGIQWFAEAVFPRIRQSTTTTEFLVVGSRPPQHVQRLMTSTSRIQVTGYVPDLEPFLARSAVLVVPLHSGSGMRVKILEAFARGIPVVSTSIGVEGIDAIEGEHLLVADEPLAFAAAVLRVLDNPELAARLARSAREFVERRYDWRTALRPLDRIYPVGAAVA